MEIVKKILIIILISVPLKLRADMYEPNIYRKGFVYAYVYGVAGFCLVEYFRYHGNRNIEGLKFGIALDPKMLFTEGIDVRLKTYLNYNRFEPAIVYEYFYDMQYNGISACIDYVLIDRKLSFIPGLETTTIFNSGVVKQSIGVNFELRFLTRKNICFSYISNLKSRPELSESKNDFMYSGYIQVGFDLIRK